jgi:hypothetical protein
MGNYDELVRVQTEADVAYFKEFACKDKGKP